MSAMHIDPTGMNPEVADLGIRLGEAALRNSAGAVLDKIRTIKARRNDKETINELDEIINGLLDDKSELVRIAEAYRQELVAQQISEDDIQYITESFIPRLEELITRTASDATVASVQQTLDGIKPLLSVEMLTVLQLIGFNFKRAIGEPLTLLLQKFITSQVPQDPQSQLELTKLNVVFNTELAKIAQNKSATERWVRLRGPVPWEQSEQ